MKTKSFFVALLIISISTIHEVNATDTKNIRGVEIYFHDLVFDRYASRKEASAFWSMSCSKEYEYRGLIVNQNELNEFFGCLDSIKYHSQNDLSPYCDYSGIKNFPGTFRYDMTSGIISDCSGYVIIHFNDGRLPELMWFDNYGLRRQKGCYDLSFNDIRSLFDIVEKLKIKGDEIEETVKKWQQEPIDCSNISKIQTLFLTDTLNGGISRAKFIEYANSFKASSDSLLLRHEILANQTAHNQLIKDFMTELNALRYKKTLFYDTENTLIMCHIGHDGRFVWDDYEDKVIGMISIFRNEELYPEIIWVTQKGLERSYFLFTMSERLKEVISKIQRSPQYPSEINKKLELRFHH